NKNLEKEIEKGTFREDLYYRLNVIPIDVPPLRERIEDLPLLVEAFLAEFAVQNRSKRKTMSLAAISILSNYAWPGNVRELRNLVERLAIMVDKDVIDVTDIPDSYRPGGLTNPSYAASAPFMKLDNFKEAKKAFEKEFIKIKLVQNENNVTKTAKAMKVGRSYLHKKIKSLN
ncbi:MAG: sigma-54-dependent Fis family transcriptional regulator, partial [Deltaproteobacteria bacterium]|nr:sigma-54-dependent Fis family transcriptional regulator [Deltaproteobacteria bacterium]